MSKMGLCSFSDGYLSTDLVAPKSDYPTKEAFIKACLFEWDGYEWGDKIAIENVTEAHCRFYRVPPEGLDFDGGCYSFGPTGKGAFPVWRIDLQGRKKDTGENGGVDGMKYAIKLDNEYMQERFGEDCFTDDLGYAILFDTEEQAKDELIGKEYAVQIDEDEDGGLYEVLPKAIETTEQAQAG